MGDVGVLVFVDQHEPEPLLVEAQHLALAEQADALEQQVAEIDRVEHLETVLIGRVERCAAPAGKARRLSGRHLVGVSPRFFHPSIRVASTRAGQRFSSMSSASRSCLSSRI